MHHRDGDAIWWGRINREYLERYQIANMAIELSAGGIKPHCHIRAVTYLVINLPCTALQLCPLDCCR